MTDFRKFCWATFISMGVAAALANRGFMDLPRDGLLTLGIALGCVFVNIFGSERKDPRP